MTTYWFAVFVLLFGTYRSRLHQEKCMTAETEGWAGVLATYWFAVVVLLFGLLMGAIAPSHKGLDGRRPETREQARHPHQVFP